MLIRRAGALRRAPNQEETWCEIKFVGHVKHLLSKQCQGLCSPLIDKPLVDYTVVIVGLINCTIVCLCPRLSAFLLHWCVFLSIPVVQTVLCSGLERRRLSFHEEVLNPPAGVAAARSSNRRPAAARCSSVVMVEMLPDSCEIVNQ